MFLKSTDKLNIGCGLDIRKGFLNLDLHPASWRVKRFDITDEKDLSWLRCNKTSIIECHHVIGYLMYAQATEFFKAAYESLNENGELILEFPDILKISKKIFELHNPFLINISEINSYVECIRGIYAFDPEDIYNKNFSEKTYIFGWSSDFTTATLKDVGFCDVIACDPITHDKRTWRDTRIVAKK